VIWQPVQPGNVGTLIRSAAAFGARGVVAVGGADPWNEKSVRASAGAIHRIAVARAEEPSMTSLLLEHGRRVAAAVAHGGVDPGQVDWSQLDLLLLGSETQGVPLALSASATVLTIPLAGGVESLGVAMAGTVLLSLARRMARA
jgi:TrmH family RNA methyltransferase